MGNGTTGALKNTLCYHSWEPYLVKTCQDWLIIKYLCSGSSLLNEINHVRDTVAGETCLKKSHCNNCVVYIHFRLFHEERQRTMHGQRCILWPLTVSTECWDTHFDTIFCKGVWGRIQSSSIFGNCTLSHIKYLICNSCAIIVRLHWQTSKYCIHTQWSQRLYTNLIIYIFCIFFSECESESKGVIFTSNIIHLTGDWCETPIQTKCSS